MATIGLRDLYRAPITVEESGEEKYGTPVRMAKAISAEMSVEVAEAILYADDGADEVVKEFVSGELTLNVNDLMLTNKDLPEKAKRKRKYRKVKTAKRAPRGKSIEKRPAEVEGREVFGHWEMDTVYSGKQTSKKALLVLTERKTRQEIIERMPDRTEESTIKALDRIERRFGALFRKVFKTITVDNGGEFSNVERLEQSAIRKGKRTRFYYCHPYSSFERGSNENQNRMIRRRYPKGTDFGKVSTAAIKELEQWINNYPREILGWKTSAMCFRECLDAL